MLMLEVWIPVVQPKNMFNNIFHTPLMLNMYNDILWILEGHTLSLHRKFCFILFYFQDMEL